MPVNELVAKVPSEPAVSQRGIRFGDYFRVEAPGVLTASSHYIISWFHLKNNPAPDYSVYLRVILSSVSVVTYENSPFVPTLQQQTHLVSSKL